MRFAVLQHEFQSPWKLFYFEHSGRMPQFPYYYVIDGRFNDTLFHKPYIRKPAPDMRLGLTIKGMPS
ncbi:MAG: hypothetical protein ACRCS5_12730 [Sphingomonas sp.]|jgi:hypothetical protein|nr:MULTISPECIES: hypothetical protein [unclassified Sphingomonas]MDR6850086.1 hypothetical protein [Sphingomonas sp. BE137]MDR7257905.1 hypothetical protein [Sphingomonas sp. BE270]RUN77744.1 hypothetical protein EJC47_04995 [Sphingomonas sp. TF3]